ncbi:MAG: hypothetical protein RIC16_08710 [Rhodospirillales bacterium]
MTSTDENGAAKPPQPKSSPGRSPAGDRARAEREQRSAEALRRNLARRKAQLRGRKETGEGDSSD